MKKSELYQIIKEEINEISPELFKRATDISRSRGQDRRTISMGETFFSKFRGKPLMGGTIINVYYQKPQQAGYENVTVKIESPSSVVPGETKSRYVTYDVKGDSWDVEDEITRADARILSLIAQHIEHHTRYKSGGEGFRIKGYGSNESLNENSEKYMFFQNLETIKKEVEEMLSLDPQTVDAILANGHDWAADHISTSKDDVEEVHNFLMSNKAPMDEKKLSAKQMKIAKAAPPEDKITGADFAALRKGLNENKSTEMDDSYGEIMMTLYNEDGKEKGLVITQKGDKGRSSVVFSESNIQALINFLS
jgi:hypothetical protein